MEEGKGITRVRLVLEAVHSDFLTELRSPEPSEK